MHLIGSRSLGDTLNSDVPTGCKKLGISSHDVAVDQRFSLIQEYLAKFVRFCLSADKAESTLACNLLPALTSSTSPSSRCVCRAIVAESKATRAAGRVIFRSSARALSFASSASSFCISVRRKKSALSGW
jgi:hypothetical protein